MTNNSNRDRIQQYFEKEHGDFDALYSDPRKIKDFVRWAQYWYGKKPIIGRLKSLVELIGDNIKGVKILEVGSGPGYYSIELARKGAEVKGIDFAGGMVEIAKRNAEKIAVAVDFKKADIFEFNEDGKFEYVFATGVIEYIEPRDQKRFLSKLASLSKRYVIVSFPKKYVLHAFIRYLWLRFLKGFRIKYFMNREIAELASVCGLKEVDRRDVGILWVVKFEKT